MLATPDLPLYQPCCLEHAHVARHSSKGHGQRSRQIGDARLAIAQRDQQPPPGRVGQRGIGASPALPRAAAGPRGMRAWGSCHGDHGIRSSTIPLIPPEEI